MTDKLLEQVSSLADDELPAREAETVLLRLSRDSELRDSWERYLLIGEAMRGSMAPVHGRDFANGVAAAIDRETLPKEGFFSSGRALRHLRPVAGMAVAASVAMLAVFTLQAPQQLEAPAEVVPGINGNPGSVPLMSAQQVDFSGVRSPELQNQLRRYLLNHSEHSDSVRLRGVMPYVQLAAHDSRPVAQAAADDDAETPAENQERRAPEVPRR